MNVNLLVSCDANYLEHAVVTLTSVCENNRQHRIRIFHLHAGLPPEEMASVQAHFQQYPASVEFIPIDDGQLRQFNTPEHVATPTFYRLLCADLLPPDVDRVLYLDSDVIVRSALDGIWGMDLRGQPVAAVADAYLNDPASRARLGTLVGNEVPVYLNAGVMLIDIPRFRADGIGPAALALLGRLHRDLAYADQDALNAVLAGRWTRLPARWNAQSMWFTPAFCFAAMTLPPEQRDEVVQAVFDPAIVHYTTASKPWQFMNTHPLKHEYWVYRQRTPYAVGDGAAT
jgi:lipopolysaccharide biosynthesis glycosyltransferase